MTRYLPFLALAATVALATSANAENIVDEHIKAVGGADKIAAVKAIERSGKVELTGPFGVFQGSIEESTDVAAKRGHRLMDLGIFVIESAFTGDKGWQDGPPQGLRDMQDEELQQAKMNANACLVAAIKDEKGLEAFGEPADEKFNEKDCLKIEVKETPLQLYVNKETKLLEGLGVGDQMTITFEDYAEVDGVQFANKSTMNVAAQDINIVTEYEETKLNGEIKDDLFAKPEPVDAE